MPTKFKHIGLFEGIGGFSLAGRWMGWETVAYSEIDKFCISKMKKNFPNAKNLGDIKNINAKEYENKIDIITGGFPCQPFSVAGNQNGRNDERYLWGAMLRVIIDVKPTYVVAENVPGLATIEDGLVLRQILFDLEDAAYKVQVFDIPVAAKSAPHKRNRLWIVAHAESRDEWIRKGEQEEGSTQQPRVGSKQSDTADSYSTQCEGDGISFRFEQEFHRLRLYWDSHWGTWPIKPTICRDDDGIPNRVDRVKALGNAICPQIAFAIFKSIEYAHEYHTKKSINIWT